MRSIEVRPHIGPNIYDLRSRLELGRQLANDVRLAALEYRSLEKSEEYRYPQKIGDGRPFVFIPGFLGPEFIFPYARVLKGYVTTPSVMFNLPRKNTFDAIKEKVEKKVEFTGKKAIMFGHSIGGVMAKVFAKREPDLVSDVWMFGAPIYFNNPKEVIHPYVLELFKRLVPNDRDFQKALEDSRQPLASDIKLVSVYSRSDPIVNWRASFDAKATNIEVEGSHIGLISNKNVLRELLVRLPRVNPFRVS